MLKLIGYDLILTHQIGQCFFADLMVSSQRQGTRVLLDPGGSKGDSFLEGQDLFLVTYGGSSRNLSWGHYYKEHSDLAQACCCSNFCNRERQSTCVQPPRAGEETILHSQMNTRTRQSEQWEPGFECCLKFGFFPRGRAPLGQKEEKSCERGQAPPLKNVPIPCQEQSWATLVFSCPTTSLQQSISKALQCAHPSALEFWF